jgi:adenosine/AMP kinase
MELEFECIAIEKDEGTSAILGHAGFIKTVEDKREQGEGTPLARPDRRAPGMACR